jgi:iron complex outermembrane receptor protein
MTAEPRRKPGGTESGLPAPKLRLFSRAQLEPRTGIFTVLSRCRRATVTVAPHDRAVNLSPTKSIQIFKFAAACGALGLIARLPARAADAADSVSVSTNADQIVRLNEMEVFSAPTSALTQAPIEAPLDALEPKSIINAQTLNNQIAPTADYAEIAALAPSIVNIETSGPGLSESKMLSMRGFSDGQYNVTYDGIPFGDANGQTHHTTSYFPAKVIGSENIDRGPGTASDIGENTFGGTIGILSKDPRPDQATVLTLSDGTWNTFLGNLEVNTGNLAKLNGGSMVATYQYMSSDTYRSFSYLQRNTYYFKYLQPIGKEGMLTVVGNYNNIKFNNPGTVTQAQINAYGRNFGLDANPFDTNNDYYPYNYQQKQADFEYIGFADKFGGDIAVENKVYTYAYNNDSHEKSVDPIVGGTTKFPGTTALYTGPAYINSSPNTLPNTGESEPAAAGVASNDDPGGQIKVNSYRAEGDYLSLSHGADSALEEKVGVWAEYEVADRYDYALDYSPAYLAANPQNAYLFGAFDPATGVKSNTVMPGWQWNMHVFNKTFQPYIDLTWKPIPNLTIEAGAKDSYYTIDLEAPLNQVTEQRNFSNNTYHNVEPHFSANYLLTSNWSAYVQWAQGLAYPLVTDEENVPNDAKDLAATGTSFNPGNLKQETTINYQLGTVYKTERFNGDIDVYLIDIKNVVSSVTDPSDSTNTLAFQSKGAWMSGIEAEGTFSIGGGLSLTANGSLNRAVYQTNPGVPSFNAAAIGAFDAGFGIPNSTASVGAVYNRSGWFASVTDKYVGPFIVYSSALVNPDLGLYGQTATGQAGGAVLPVQSGENPGFWILDIAGGYAFKMPKGSWVHSIKIKLQLDNALNHKVQILSSVGATPAANTFNVLPTTNYFLTLSGEF